MTRPDARREGDDEVHTSRRRTPGTPEYMHAHYVVRKTRGAPHRCENCGAMEGRIEWANISGDYLGPEDYRALCKSCHLSFDARRAHDRREDHAWTPTPTGARCAVCRARSKAREYQRVMADPARAARRRGQNREAVRRLRDGRRAAQ